MDTSDLSVLGVPRRSSNCIHSFVRTGTDEVDRTLSHSTEHRKMSKRLNYSKWDALELSDDSDIETHPVSALCSLTSGSN